MEKAATCSDQHTRSNTYVDTMQSRGTVIKTTGHFTSVDQKQHHEALAFLLQGEAAMSTTHPKTSKHILGATEQPWTMCSVDAKLSHIEVDWQSFNTRNELVYRQGTRTMKTGIRRQPCLSWPCCILLSLFSILRSCGRSCFCLFLGGTALSVEKVPYY
jgi:hypothetical protein